MFEGFVLKFLVLSRLISIYNIHTNTYISIIIYTKIYFNEKETWKKNSVRFTLCLNDDFEKFLIQQKKTCLGFCFENMISIIIIHVNKKKKLKKKIKNRQNNICVC